jgi:4,5-dihydroxyphthalate decarboxylase
MRAVLADYPHVQALKDGRVTGPSLEFTEVDPVHRAFAAMVREQAYDVCEMAIVTYLQARAEDKPLLLLPVVLRSRFQHDHIVCRADDPLEPSGLAGKRVGVRTYAQTTGVWLRGILSDEYGVPLDHVQWVSIEDGHLAEYADPPQVERAPDGSKLIAMLLAGELDAVIMGQDLPDDPRLRPLIPEAKTAARSWYERRRAVPINHMVVIRSAHEGLRDELTRMFVEAKLLAGPPASVDMTPVGVEANAPALELITRYAHEQGLIPRPLTVAELFAAPRGSVS